MDTIFLTVWTAAVILIAVAVPVYLVWCWPTRPDCERRRPMIATCRHDDPATSHEAAASCGRHTHKRAVLLALRVYGGLTAKQIEARLWRVGIEVSGESVRGSICELEREGKIQRCFRRPNPSGRKARVWWTPERLCEYLTERTVPPGTRVTNNGGRSNG